MTIAPIYIVFYLLWNASLALAVLGSPLISSKDLCRLERLALDLDGSIDK